MGEIKRVFACEAAALAEVRAFVRGFLEAEGVQKREAELLVLGINEAYSNVIRHAVGTREPVELRCESAGGVLRFRLRDFGDAVDPAGFRRRPAEAVEPGGLGLHLMERIFDGAVYHPKAPGTELELTKLLGEARGGVG